MIWLTRNSKHSLVRRPYLEADDFLKLWMGKGWIYSNIFWEFMNLWEFIWIWEFIRNQRKRWKETREYHCYRICVTELIHLMHVIWIDIWKICLIKFNITFFFSWLSHTYLDLCPKGFTGNLLRARFLRTPRHNVCIRK